MNSIKRATSEFFNHYIDWSRVADLLTSRTHQYTLRELAPRALILGASSYSAYLLARPQTAAKIGLTRANSGAVGFSIGFALSHSLVIAPLVYKRIQMSKQCNSLKKEILDKLESLKSNTQLSFIAIYSFNNQMIKLIDTVMSHDKSTEVRSNSSQTWGARKRQMTSINDALVGLQNLNEEGLETLIKDLDMLVKSEVEKVATQFKNK